jgi:hypothetical protein
MRMLSAVQDCTRFCAHFAPILKARNMARPPDHKSDLCVRASYQGPRAPRTNPDSITGSSKNYPLIAVLHQASSQDESIRSWEGTCANFLTDGYSSDRRV